MNSLRNLAIGILRVHGTSTSPPPCAATPATPPGPCPPGHHQPMNPTFQHYDEAWRPACQWTRISVMSTTLKVLLATLLLPPDGLRRSDRRSGRAEVVDFVNSGPVNWLNAEPLRLLLSVDTDRRRPAVPQTRVEGEAGSGRERSIGANEAAWSWPHPQDSSVCRRNVRGVTPVSRRHSRVRCG
jgi:hypothetical protein